VRRFLVPAFITLAAVPAAGGPARPPVPLAIDGHGGIVVDVRINAAGPFKFVLDTGAARTIVSDDLARELAAPVVAKSEVVTSAGSDMRFVVRLATIALASAEVHAVLAPVLPAANLAQLGLGVRGLLGQDFLSAFNYTLDYRRARLVWDEPSACDPASSVRMIRAEGRFVVTLEGDDGAPVRMVPDTGAEVAVLFRGRAPVPSVSRVRVGAATLRHVRAIVIDRHDENADGLLPLHRFASVSFAAQGACLTARM
jgi:predicted aspartyl protease